ncbi:hypothetical protein V5O48_005194 [Marasmius crinis-equi]|uniref:F-box domain-containing protein n=1 Tax=Marasmius crinis-equi TaxID=585013 RepID=A0ABR3FMZ7_9AGAR
MNELCEKCKFTPRFQYPPVSKDEFRSFCAPPIEDLRRVISEEEQDVAGYASEIARLEDIVRRLKEEKDALEERLRDRRKILSVLRRIPRELLIEIFGYCAAPDPAATTPTVKDMDPLTRFDQDDEWRRALAAPFILAHVSSRWREIILDTPMLWSTICVSLLWYNPPVSVLRLYLERSKDAGLDVTIRDSGKENMEAVLALFSPNVMARFRRLTILDSESAPHIHHAFHDGLALPRLESLHMWGTATSQLRWSWLWEAIRRAPRLNKVFAGGWDDRIPFEVLRESNVRSLDLTKLSNYGDRRFEQHLPSVLPTLRSLESLTLRNLTKETSWSIFPLVRYENLRDLTIVHLESGTYNGLLQQFDLPNLVSLRLNFRKQIRSFEELLIPLSNFSSLRLLSLTFNWPPADRIARILDKVPNLTVFAAGVHNHSLPFDSLAPFPQLCAELAQRPTICPKLRSFTLGMEEDRITRSMLENLQGFIEGRGSNDGCSTLSRVKLITTPPMEHYASQDEGVTAALQSVRTACPNFEYNLLSRVLFKREKLIESYHSFLD